MLTNYFDCIIFCDKKLNRLIYCKAYVANSCQFKVTLDKYLLIAIFIRRWVGI